MKDNNTSKVLTGKDGSRSSVNQPDILAKNRDACEDKNDFESDTIDDDCWNDDVSDIKDNPSDENEKKKHMNNKEIANYTGDEHIIEISDESIEIKDTKESKKDNVQTNDKEINPRRKTDMIPDIELSNRAKNDQPLDIEHINNDLEGDRKVVTENSKDNRERLNNDTENEKEVATELQIDNEDKTRKCIEKGKKGISGKPMATRPNTYKFQVI